MDDSLGKASSVPPPLTEAEVNDMEQRLIDQSKGATIKPFWVAKADSESVKNWDRFYKRNQANFFKDRHYLTDEFVALTQIIHSNNADNQAITFMEIGCGVGNALFPVIDELSEMIHSHNLSKSETTDQSVRRSIPRISFYGSDCSKNAIALCEQRKAEYFAAHQATDLSTLPVESINFWVQDLLTEDFPQTINQSIDYGTLIFVLSALKTEDHPVVLQRVASSLAPNGRIFIRDYCELDYAQLRFQSSNKLGESFYLRSDGTRSYFFKLDELVALVTNSGLEIESATVVEKEVLNRKVGAKMRRRFVQVVGRKPSG